MILSSKDCINRVFVMYICKLLTWFMQITFNLIDLASLYVLLCTPSKYH
uniref:G-protein coupled receptors family 1 profile domain-containing protein n=1 Tax=Ascaris lumbricoides TaxID=6252 RepID=A0A0M3IKR6_ASCLU